jgi:thiol:disulfide interchange protein DsbC
MRILLTGLLVCVAACGSPAKRVSGDIERTVRSALPSTSIDAIRETAFPGVYEVEAGSNLFYAEASGRYLFIGHIYDLKTSTDITQQRIDALKESNLAIAFPVQFPTDAILEIGAGPSKITILFDPECAWCQRQLGELAGEQITVRLVMQPPKGQEEKSIRLLCSGANADLLLQASSIYRLPAPEAECSDKKRQAIEWVRNWVTERKLSGTPVLISEDGRVHKGYLPKNRLFAWIKTG